MRITAVRLKSYIHVHITSFQNVLAACLYRCLDLQKSRLLAIFMILSLYLQFFTTIYIKFRANNQINNLTLLKKNSKIQYSRPDFRLGN